MVFEDELPIVIFYTLNINSLLASYFVVFNRVINKFDTCQKTVDNSHLDSYNRKERTRVDKKHTTVMRAAVSSEILITILILEIQIL